MYKYKTLKLENKIKETKWYLEATKNIEFILSRSPHKLHINILELKLK